MSIAPELRELRRRLESVGVVVVEDPTHITIRLPFFCSVRVELVDGRLKFEAFFGVMRRVPSTVLKLVPVAAIALAFARTGVLYLVGAAAVMGLIGAYEVIRWLVTEQAITRAMLLAAQPPLGERHQELLPPAEFRPGEIPVSSRGAQRRGT